MPHLKTQLKSPTGLGRMSQKYGPGFVAMSMKSGRVLASGKDINAVFEKVKKSPLFKKNQIIFRHVPPPNRLVIYGLRLG